MTSADLKAATEAATAATTAAVTSSPSRAKALKEEESTRAARSSPKPGCSHSTSSEPAHFAVSFLFAIFYLTLIDMRQGGFTPLIIFGLDFVS